MSLLNTIADGGLKLAKQYRSSGEVAEYPIFGISPKVVGITLKSESIRWILYRHNFNLNHNRNLTFLPEHRL